MNNFKTYSIILLVGITIGGIVAKMYFPTTKEVAVEKEVVRTDVKTITKVVEKKDGTKETTIETTDKSVKQEQKTETKITNKQKDYHINIGTSYNFKDKSQDYSLNVEKRIAGPLFLGVSGNSNGSVGLSVGLEF